MSTSKSSATICLPAHILDAHISPRAREVLMLLASQTNVENPTVWVCHAAIAERLHCSPITVKRAVQKLVEAKLIDETGDLHERRYKFYRVSWSMNSAMPAKAGIQSLPSDLWTPAFAGVTKKEPAPAPVEKQKPAKVVPPQPQKPILPLDQVPKDGSLAPFMERAKLMHEEYLRRYQIKLF